MNAMIVNVLSLLLILCIVRSTSCTEAHRNRPTISGSGPTPRERAEKLLTQMTLDEKLTLVHGSTCGCNNSDYAGVVVPNVRLSIPPINLEDGPQGVGDGTLNTTCWPSMLSVVSAWDTDLMFRWGAAMGKEQWMKGTNVMLGPMMNLARVPYGGRNFESFGEDPHLASALVVPMIQGIQSSGVIACAKHWAVNNQEFNRTTTSAMVDERTLHEIYFPAFKSAVQDGNVGSIMCSYNRINDIYACENNYTLNTVLKEMWGFSGWVMSDWGATHSSYFAANSGLDQQMPDDYFFGKPLRDAVDKGLVTLSRVDDMVLRILTPMFAVGIFDNPQTGNLTVNTCSKEHNQLSKELSIQGTILLKNDNVPTTSLGNMDSDGESVFGGIPSPVLPIDLSSISSIAVLGDDARDNPTVASFGSGYVVPPYIITPFDAIQAQAQSSNVTYANTSQVSLAMLLAKSADVAIVFVASNSSEGYDRDTLELDEPQTTLIQKVCSVQPRTVVVAHIPGAVVMTPWIDCVPSVVIGWMPGQEDGNAIADVLFGKHNPSGRLPITMPARESDNPVGTPDQYPGVNNEAVYSEGLFIGYRWYDANDVAPLFPFGHGLSYTSFSYSNLTVSGFQVSFLVGNVGVVDGTEIPQLYLSFPSIADEPPNILKKFAKVHIAKSATVEVTFTLSPEDFSVWDSDIHDWKVIRGMFMVLVGASSRDIRLTGSIVM